MVTGFLSIAGQQFSRGEWLCSIGNSKSKRRDWVFRTGGHLLVSGCQGVYQTSHNAQHPPPPKDKESSSVNRGIVEKPWLDWGLCSSVPSTTPQMRKWAWLMGNTREKIQTAYSSLLQSFQNHLTPIPTDVPLFFDQLCKAIQECDSGKLTCWCCCPPSACRPQLQFLWLVRSQLNPLSSACPLSPQMSAKKIDTCWRTANECQKQAGSLEQLIISFVLLLCTAEKHHLAQNWQNLLTRSLANKGLDGLRKNATKWDILERLVKFSEMYTKNALKIKRLMIWNCT